MKAPHLFHDMPGDGTRHGPWPLYDEHEAILKAAIIAPDDFDTGWFTGWCMSGRIQRVGRRYTCSVSVWDDFDTEGRGQSSFVANASVDDTLERIGAALHEAGDRAEENRRDNEVYVGFSVGHAHADGTRANWLATYVAPVGDGHLLSEPPGDYYHEWGWQDDEVPEPARTQLAAWCESATDERRSPVIDGWVAELWEN